MAKQPLINMRPESKGLSYDRPAASQIFGFIRDAIISMELLPGQMISETALAQQFGVSRTPVREALQQLAARDLVRIAPRQGVTVARLSISQVRAIMESVGELEALCAKLAARRVDDVLRKELDKAIERCQDTAAVVVHHDVAACIDRRRRRERSRAGEAGKGGSFSFSKKKSLVSKANWQVTSPREMSEK